MQHVVSSVAVWQDRLPAASSWGVAALYGEGPSKTDADQAA